MAIIFEDDFEKGFVPYSITGAPVISNSPVHHGSFSAKCTNDVDAIKADFLPQPFIYHRFVFQVTALPNANGEFLEIAEGRNSAGVQLYRFYIAYHNAPAFLRFNLTVRNAAAWTDNYSANGQTIAVNTWYTAEIYWLKGASGHGTLWINDVSKVDVTSNTSSYGDCTQIMQTITNSLGGDACTVTHDCVKVATERIYAEVQNQPIVYPTTVVQEMAQLPSTTTAVAVENFGARVRHLKHATAISPWTAQ